MHIQVHCLKEKPLFCVYIYTPTHVPRWKMLVFKWTNDGNMSIDIHYTVHVHVYMYMHAQNSHKQCSINQKSFELPPLRFKPSTLSMHVYNFYGITTVSLLKGIVLSLIMHAYVHRSMHLYSVCAKHMYITVCSLSMHPRVCACVCVCNNTPLTPEGKFPKHFLYVGL